MEIQKKPLEIQTARGFKCKPEGAATGFDHWFLKEFKFPLIPIVLRVNDILFQRAGFINHKPS